MLELKPGEIITTTQGRKLEILHEIGRGGQGIVYKVRSGNRDRALKWYLDEAFFSEENRDAFKENLIANILDGVPSGGEKNFIWPIDLVESDKHGTFGYLMELIPDGYSQFSSYQKNLIFSSRKARIRSMIGICRAFDILHHAGYKYQDINNGNIFIRAGDGAVLICDNDNVSKGDRANGVIGKDWYMAPEVVTGKKLPDQTTDRFSLAVILFYLCCKGHPLIGRKLLTLDEPMGPRETVRFLGEEPVFLFDEQDDSNRPVAGINDYMEILWRSMPPFVRSLFQKAFSRGSMYFDPETGYGASRVTELEWMGCLYRWFNSLLMCSCDRHPEWVFNQLPAVCPVCGKKLPINGLICVKDYQHPLHPGVVLTAQELQTESESSGKLTILPGNIAGRPESVAIGNQTEGTCEIIKCNGEKKYLQAGKKISADQVREVHSCIGNFKMSFRKNDDRSCRQ